MRKANLYVVLSILVLMLAHGIMGALKIAGADTDALKVMAWAAVGLIALHVVIATVLTCKTFKAMRASGTHYIGQNKLFWLRRVSGLAILIPLILHLVIFRASQSGGAYRLMPFTQARLVSQLLLVAAVALHVLTNIEPLLVSMGIFEYRAYTVDLLLILSVCLGLFAVGFILYYGRWMAF